MEAMSAKRRRQIDQLYESWDVNASGYLEVEEIQVVLNKWKAESTDTFKEGNAQLVPEQMFQLLASTTISSKGQFTCGTRILTNSYFEFDAVFGKTSAKLMHKMAETLFYQSIKKRTPSRERTCQKLAEF